MLNRYLKNKQVVCFKIPCYPEMATKNIWSLIKYNPDLLSYFPDLKNSQIPEKEFLLGILCTLKPDAVREIIATGKKNRSPNEQEDKDNLIEITGELMESIMNLYSMKSMYPWKLTIALLQPQRKDWTTC